MKPNVLCVGFAKCGTTSLYEIMKQHDKIYLPAIKEPSYYNIPELYEKGFPWYINRYYDKKIQKPIIMEINNNISMVPISKIRDVCRDYGSDTKIIVILRNPIEKAYSYFKFTIKTSSVECLEYYDRRKTNSSNFKEFVRKNKKMLSKQITDNIDYPGNVLLDGLYFERISEYKKFFGKDNVKVVIFEDFIKNPKTECESIFNFLKINPCPNINYNIKANESNRKTYGQWSIKINAFIVKHIYVKFCIKTLPFINYGFTSFIRFFRTMLINLFSYPSSDKSKIDDKTRKILNQYYWQDVRNLEKLLSISLGDKWNI